MNESHIEKLRRAIASVDADLAATQKGPDKENESEKPEPSLAQPDTVSSEKERFFQMKKGEMESAKAAYQSAVENKNSAEMAIHHARMKELEGEIRNNSGDAPGANEYLIEYLNDKKDIDRYWGKKRPAKKLVAQAQTPQPAEPRAEAPAPEPRAVEPAPRETEPATPPVAETAPAPAPAPAAPETGRPAAAEFDQDRHNQEVHDLLHRVDNGNFQFFVSPEMRRLAQEHGIAGWERMTPQEVVAALRRPMAGTAESRVNEAKDRYERAKERHKQARGTWGLKGFIKRDSRDTAEHEMEVAKHEYEQARAEYAASSAERFVEVESQKAQERFREQLKINDPETAWGKFKKYYNKVGNASIYDVVKKMRGGKEIENKFLRFGLKVLNVKNAAAFALVGSTFGWSWGAFKAGEVVAGSAAMIATKRLLGGVGGMVGFSDIYRKKAASKHESGAIDSGYLTLAREDDWRNLRTDVLLQKMRDIELASTLNRKNPAENPKYKELLQILYAKEAENRAGRLDALMATTDQEINKRFKQINRRAKYAGALGAALGSGMLQLGIRRGLGWFAEAGPSAPDAPKIFQPENPAPSPKIPSADFIPVGERGIEGALLDLQKTNPDLYEKMIGKLHELDPNFKGDDGGLVHRYIDKLATERGFNIDEGGGKDWSRIFGANVEIGSDGLPDVNNVNVMPDMVHEAASPGDAAATAETTEIPLVERNAAADMAALKMGSPDIASELDALKEAGTAEAANAPSAPAVETEAQASEGLADDSQDQLAETEQARQEALANAREAAAMNAAKTSDSLNLLLNREYNSFLKDALHTSAAKLNALKDMTYGQFADRLVSEPAFQKDYGNLAEAIAGDLGKGIDVKGGDTSMRELLFAMAKKFQAIK